MPPGATVSFDASPIAGLEHHLWMLDGTLTLEVEGVAVLAARRRLPALRARRTDAVQESRQARGALRRRDGAAVSAAGDVTHRRVAAGSAALLARCRPRRPRGRAARRRLRRRRRQLRRAVLGRRGARVLGGKVLPGVRARTRRVLVARLERTDRRHGADRSRDAAEPAASRRGPEAARAPGGPPARHRARV